MNKFCFAIYFFFILQIYFKNTISFLNLNNKANYWSSMAFCLKKIIFPLAFFPKIHKKKKSFTFIAFIAELKIAPKIFWRLKNKKNYNNL